MRTTLLGTSIFYRPKISQQDSLKMESHSPSVRQKINADPIAEKTEQVNLLSEEEEKDPLALDTAIEQHSSRSKLSNSAKHSHSLRRHVPRIIVKPIPPEKKVAATATATLSSNAATSTATANTVINATSGKNATPSPSSRASSSRRAQQQAKAAAAATALTGAASMTTPITAITQASTMREVLASIPGFSFKPRRRSSKKISTAAQIEQTKDGKIDLETPDSILASTNLRALLNKQTFSMLPPLYQYNLIQLLPSVDREAIEVERKNTSESTVTMEAIKLGPSSLNNEFFARACLEWRERLAEGEFTPENQMKMKTEAEREKNKLDPWKLKHFEPIWGEKSYNRASSTSSSSSNISYSSGKSSDSYTNLMDERLEFKLESKGGLVATIVKTSTKTPAASTTTSLTATATATQAMMVTATSAASTESTENTTSSSSVDIKEEEEEFVDEPVKSINANAIKSEQEIKLEELRQQEQTESSTTDYEKQTDTICDLENIGCTDSSSTFDLLRSECSGVQAETFAKESKITLTLNSLEHERQYECGSSGNIRKRSESDFIYENRTQSKQMKIDTPIMQEHQQQHQHEYDITDAANSIEPEVCHGVGDELKETLSPSVSSATSSSQELSGSNSLTTNSFTTKAPTTDSFMYNTNLYDAKFEQQSNAELLLKETISSASSEEGVTGNTISDMSMKTSNFLQNQETSFAAISTVGNSTCNSIETLLPSTSSYMNVNSVLPASLSPRPSGGITLQSFPTQGKQLKACSIISLEDGEDDDDELIEQKFADAHNYVLESGEVSTDSSAGTNSALLTPVDGGNVKEKKFIFCDSVDQGTTSHACDNLFENKQELGSCISSVAISSASSSSSSSMTSAPTISGDMMYSTTAQLPVTARLSPEQKQQQQQQQQIILSMAEKSEDLFHHVQHDWNFGSIKLQQPTEASSCSFNGVIQTHPGVIKMKNLNTISVGDVDMPSVEAAQSEEVVDCIGVEGADDATALVNCRNMGVSVGEGADNGDIGAEADEDDDDEADEEDEEDDDDNDAVRDIVDELQQQHRQLLKEQQQQQLQHQQQLEEQQDLRGPENQEHRGHLNYEQTDYELGSDMICDVQMAANEMEVSSTVITNSNSDDSVNEINMGCSSSRLDGGAGGASVGNVTIQLSAPSPAAIGHLHQQQTQQSQQQQTPAERQNTPQRQILVDTNGQIIGNFLVQHQQQQQQQQQHIDHQQQLLHHAAQQFTFQAAQPQPQQQQTQTIALSAQQHLQQQQQQHSQKSHQTLSTIRKAIEMSTNGQHYLTPGGLTAQQHIGQQLVLQQQAPQQRHFLTQPQVPTVSAAANCNMVSASPTQQHQIQVQQQLQRFQQQQQQQQHMPAFQSLATQAQSNATKYISKQMNLITMSRGTGAGTVAGTSASIASVTIPPGAAVNTFPPFSSASAKSARSAELVVNAAPNISNVNTTNVNVASAMKGLTQAGIPTTIAQQRPTSKLATGKGRKTVNKLPPGAVNLERSYQICQAVIQNSPNRENLKAQLRPPSAILNQQQHQHPQQQQQLSQGNIATTLTMPGTGTAAAAAAPPTCPISVATSAPSASSTSSSQNFIKQEDLTSIPANIMGVGRPGVYKIIGPRMGFPRKKYVQRKPSPTLIRHLFTPQTASALHTNVAANPRLQQQLTAAAAAVAQQQQQQHDLHQNGNGGGQYVLVHRANVGAADNQAPRASSAPPVPQTTQSQLHNINGIPITGRGRPASVDIDSSNAMLDHSAQQHHHLHQINAMKTNATAGMMRRNFTTGNITYIDNLSGAAAMADGNYIVTATNAGALDAEQLVSKAVAAAAAGGGGVAGSGGVGGGSGSITRTPEADNCACSLNAMVICQQCGAFCHDDCMSTSKVCVSCVIR